MICSGLKNNKLSLKQARDKYEEFIELDLIDEDHQEEIENMFSDAEADEFYWKAAKKDYLRSRNDYEDEDDFFEDDFEEDD